MLNHSVIRKLYKTADSINSNNLIVAEWNMNKYSIIKRVGLYKGKGEDPTYQYASPNIMTGDNYIVYDRNEIKKDPASSYFSKLVSVFQPNRPDPGIVYVQKFENMVYTNDIANIRVSNLSTASARFYPVSEEKQFDYFNSAKILGVENNQPISGVSNLLGRIENVNPFIVYEDKVLCNKIVIKVQNHISVPYSFAVDILIGSTWTQIYEVPFDESNANNPSAIISSTDDFATGTLELYLQANGTWSKTVSRMTDFDELIASSPTQLKKIDGIRFRPNAMINISQRDNKIASLELIEISPRLEADVTEYVESFNINSSIGDSTNFGLPVGSVVSGTGNITLSNEDGQFLFASVLSTNKMLNEDVKFTIFQKVYVPSPTNETFNVPLGVLYSNEWNIGEDYSVSVNLEDGLKYLRQLSAPDLIISSYAAMSTIILMILDNVGITGLEFKKSSDVLSADKEDTVIKNFFCKKEQTVAEVLEQIALATQCSIFYDAVGNLNVLTKERLTENAEIQESISPSDSSRKTDFWFVMDENVNSLDPERFYLSGSYTANVVSLTEEKISPITDGDITYHFYGPKKQALAASLADTKKDLYSQLKIDQFPMNALAFSNFDYSTTILWSAPEDNSSAFGAANILKDINDTRLKDIYTSTYIKINENEAVRAMYSDPARKTPEFRQSLIIYLDTNEGYTFPEYEGFVLVDNEYIKYKGKLFYVAGTSGVYGYKIIFSEEEFAQLVSSLGKGDSLSFKGLVVEVKFKIVNKSDNKYEYRVIGDGRGRYNTDVSKHYSLIEESDGVDPTKRFKLMLGESANFKVPGELNATTKFNFMDKIKYKSAKKFLGTIPRESIDTYLGFLKISGPTGLRSDTEALDSIVTGTSSKKVSDRLEKINDDADKAVPGNFDDYIYLEGERAVYGQRITLPFSPNSISTRMRLYSPRKTVRKNQEIMSTNSSIAGIGFNLNNQGEGYYIEVESAGSGKNIVEKEAFLNNLRFYKVSLEKDSKGKVVFTPTLLMRSSVGGFTVFDTSVQVIKSDNTELDPVFELEVLIRQYKNGMKYTIFYGDTKIGDYIEPFKDKEKELEAININSKNICMFVRNDSQAIFEYMMASAKPFEKDPGTYFRGKKEFERRMEQGIIPINKSFLFTDEKGDALFYYNDFARLARQVKEYDIRFASPALSSALIDISSVNPQYLIKKYSPTAFGAKITVANISSGAIRLSENTNLPLMIVGIGLEELSSGTVSAKDLYKRSDEEKGLRQNELEQNTSIYGSQTFSLDSQYIQTISQAQSLMQWVLTYCSRQRLKITMEIFENPLLELGDKVKIFDKSRQYYMNNPLFGSKTFVVSSISRSVSNSGPSMNITITEVGES